MGVIDLRSDTVTLPSPEMRRFIHEAEVGDDVYGEDPTVAALERRTAEFLGMEAALFVPSGTMGNQVAIGALTQPGDELICDSTAHVYIWEAGGIARHWGVTPRPITPPSGLLSLSDLEGTLRPDDGHYVRTRLVCLENTLNRRGGRVHPFDSVRQISSWARANGLSLHLDGARLLNAVVASGIPADEWAHHFDTVSLCFSKGLGAPVGSVLAGSAQTIARAHRLRKLLGGGMRQAGILAAGALFALDHNIPLLADDHAHARLLADAVESTPGLSLESGPVETNLVWFVADPRLGTARDVADRLRREGVLISPLGAQVLRACTHLDISRADAEAAASAIRRLSPPR